MTNEVAEKIVRGITDKIECNTVNIDDWAEFWGFTREEYEEFLDMAIKALEQTNWIPCSERSPEKDGEYLLYGKVVDENEDNHIFIGLYDEGSEGFGWWQDYYDNRTLGFLDSDFTEYASVLAWMPLPDDYEEGDSE